jgi:hypothetical protein
VVQFLQGHGQLLQHPMEQGNLDFLMQDQKLEEVCLGP